MIAIAALFTKPSRFSTELNAVLVSFQFPKSTAIVLIFGHSFLRTLSDCGFRETAITWEPAEYKRLTRLLPMPLEY